MISATALAKQRVAEILDVKENAGKVFRVSISGGGCSGFQYGFDLTEREEDDIVIDESGPHAIVTDTISQMYLEGAVLDFKADPFMQAFVLENPNVKTTCGCGASFSV